MQIEILLFDGFDDLDAFGPNELCDAPRRCAVRGPLRHARGAAEVVTGLGTALHPRGALAERPDLLMVPGGG